MDYLPVDSFSMSNLHYLDQSQLQCPNPLGISFLNLYQYANPLDINPSLRDLLPAFMHFSIFKFHESSRSERSNFDRLYVTIATERHTFECLVTKPQAPLLFLLSLFVLLDKF